MAGSEFKNIVPKQFTLQRKCDLVASVGHTMEQNIQSPTEKKNISDTLADIEQLGDIKTIRESPFRILLK